MKNNKNKNVNRIKSKEKAKVVAKPKGYYYSAANINKRKELQKKINNKNDIQADVNMNDCNEDFIIKKTKNNLNNNININNRNNNNNNNLELYNKNNLLLNYIENERKEYSIVLNKLKLINHSIGHIILKPKIKNFEINKKLIREKEKREQEELNFHKNISDKIDQALNNANLALDNIRNLGKPKSSKPPMANNNNSSNNTNNNSKNNLNYYEYKKEKEKNDLINLAQKCLDKYVDNIQINISDHDEYFITISKQRKLFKDAKEQLQSAKYRLRNSGSFFDEIFKSKINSQKSNINTNKEIISLSILSKEIFFKENIFIRVNSFLKSEIFQKLFVKVLYNDNFIENPNNSNNTVNLDSNNNNDIYNIFSLWIIIKDLINLLNGINNNNVGISFINKNIISKLYDDNNNNNLIRNTLNSHFFKNNIFNVVEKYLLFLNRKNNNSLNFDENQIFSQDYHKLYEICFKLEQSKIAQYIMNNIENNSNFINQNIISNTKEELNYYRNIQSIFVNKGKYICSIINK